MDEETVDIRRYVGVFLGRLWLIVLFAAVAGLGAYF